MDMKKNKCIAIVTLILALFCVGLLSGCAQGPTGDAGLPSGGTLYVRVNPDIAVSYDENGLVTAVWGRNADGSKILESYADYTGKDCSQVVRELVEAIGEAGYFVEEVEGQNRQITIEIERGSQLPDAAFLDNVVAGVQEYVAAMKLSSNIQLTGQTDYHIYENHTDYGPYNDGITDYNNTDYGPYSDGITDYTDYGTVPSTSPVTAPAPAPSVPATTPAPTPNAGNTAPNNGLGYGVTDYNDTDYGPYNDGVTDYNDTDYGPYNDGVTDYNNTDYGNTNYGDSFYDSNTDYGDSGYRR